MIPQTKYDVESPKKMTTRDKYSVSVIMSLHGLMVMTFASHAKGSEFDPRCEYFCLGHRAY